MASECSSHHFGKAAPPGAAKFRTGLTIDAKEHVQYCQRYKLDVMRM